MPVISVDHSLSDFASNVYNVSTDFRTTAPVRTTVTFFKHKPVVGNKSAFSNKVVEGKFSMKVRVVSDVVSIHVVNETVNINNNDSNKEGWLKFIYTFQNIEKQYLKNAYCVQERLSETKEWYNWSSTGISVIERTNKKVICELVGGSQTVALVQNTESHDRRTDKDKLVIKLMDGIAIFLLLCTALISASRLHHCIVAANLLAITLVLYSTYYLVHILCDTEVSFRRL
jgi:hypothetical protein